MTLKKSADKQQSFWIDGNNWLKKINNWGEIKGRSIWVNATFKEQKEINNSRHSCFPFTTRTLKDLLSFSIYLIDNSNKELTFNSGEKKNKYFRI